MDWAICWQLALLRSSFFLSTLAAFCAVAAPAKQVLILDSFGRDVAPYDAVLTAFRTALTHELGQPADFYETSLDLAQFSPQ